MQKMQDKIGAKKKKRGSELNLVTSDIYPDGRGVRSIHSAGGWSRRRQEHSPGATGPQRGERMLTEKRNKEAYDPDYRIVKILRV